MTLTKTYNPFITTTVFDWNYRSKAPIKNNQGGSSSGKTYSILQVIFLRLIEKKRIASVVGQDIPNLKAGSLRDFQDRILAENPWMNQFIEDYNKSERVYRFNNGSILEFKSYADEQDAKNGKRDILFVNEADGVEYAVYRQLQMRTQEETFLDYNPTSEFWVHEQVMNRPECITFYSNFTHNPFAPEATVRELLHLKETDWEAWKVYGLGKTGSIRELCIEKINIVPEMPKHLKKRGYGMDFGYRADPTTLIECGLANEKDIYLDEQFYTREMSTRDMDLVMNAIGVEKRTSVYADPADGRACDELKLRGWNIQEATKGADSVRYGLQLLNQYNLFITERSLNILIERKKYRYKIDKKTGQITNEPIDAFNHTWDAIRYWAMVNLRPLKKIKSHWRGGTA